MKVPKISIILPVYNAATYLPQILDDLIHQTLSDVEVVAVDDCSTDDSLEILKRYAGQYPMIRVLKNAQNQGVGLTRNVGLELAQGEFVGFADNDDRLELTMLQRLYEKAVSGDYDMVRCDVFVHRNGEKLPPALYPSHFADGTSELRDEMLRFLIYQMPEDHADGLWTSGVWNKIYRRSFLESNQIRFLSDREYPFEDFLFNLRVLLQSRRMARIAEPLYHHFHYDFSLGCSSYQYKSFRAGIRSISYADRLLSDSEFLHQKEYRERMGCRILSALPYNLINELKRNPQGKRAAMRELRYMWHHPLLRSAVHEVPFGMLRREPAKERVVQRIIYTLLSFISR